MRIRVTGDCASAAAIRTGLTLEGLAVTQEGPYTHLLTLLEWSGSLPGVDGIDCDLERMVVNQIALEARTDLVLRRLGGVRNEDSVTVLLPHDASQGLLAGIESGIIKGFGLYVHRRQRQRQQQQPQRQELTGSIPEAQPVVPPPAPAVTVTVEVPEALTKTMADISAGLNEQSRLMTDLVNRTPWPKRSLLDRLFGDPV